MNTCPKCSISFEITKEDYAFYEKMKVPEPTLCPSCRMQRRMVFRNERNLYKRKCDLSGKDIVSVYPPDSKYTVYNQADWWSDKWDPMKYGRDFDFSKSFFDQFQELINEVPRISLQNKKLENSDYGSDCDSLKNCYLCFNCGHSENLYYSTTFGYGKDCMDMFWSIKDELCYEGSKVFESYHSFWCFNCKNVTDCYFCEDLRSCENCFGCVGLRHKKHHIYNKQVSKEEYEAFMKEFKFTHSNIEEAKKKLAELRLKVPCRNLQIINCEDCEGDFIENSKNVTNSYDVINSEDSKYIWDGLVDNSYDCFNTGVDTKFAFECVGVYHANNIKFSDKCHYSSDVEYSEFCFNSENLFGCSGLNHKKYCILNKQYSKEEFKVLRDKIIEYMKKTKEYGEFFPSFLSHFGYNDTMAQEYFSLSKEEALKQGFNWNDYVSPKPEGVKAVKALELPESIKETSDECLSWVIECEKDGKLFKIIPQELEFYKKHNIPLPHLCPDCRHFERKHKVNPRKLWDRDCEKCHKGIKTNFAPERPEKVYCEKCYLDTI